MKELTLAPRLMAILRPRPRVTKTGAGPGLWFQDPWGTWINLSRAAGYKAAVLSLATPSPRARKRRQSGSLASDKRRRSWQTVAGS